MTRAAVSPPMVDVFATISTFNPSLPAVAAVVGPIQAILVSASDSGPSSSSLSRFLTVDELVKVATSIPALRAAIALSRDSSGITVRYAVTSEMSAPCAASTLGSSRVAMSALGSSIRLPWTSLLTRALPRPVDVAVAGTRSATIPYPSRTFPVAGPTAATMTPLNALESRPDALRRLKTACTELDEANTTQSNSDSFAHTESNSE